MKNMIAGHQPTQVVPARSPLSLWSLRDASSDAQAMIMIIYRIALLAIVLLASPATAEAKGPYQQVQALLETENTVLGEPLRLTDGSLMKLTSTIVTVNPGEETAWHKHGVPLYAYLLAGELTVDYGELGEKSFAAGSAFVEAMDHWHRGMNRGTEPVRILAVYIGISKAAPVIQQPTTGD